MKKSPFFARFLEKQQRADAAEITGGKPPVQTLRYPSDDDAFTLKYPSDDDEA